MPPARLALIFNLPTSHCIHATSLTMAAGLLLWLWTGKLPRVACRCWPHPFSVDTPSKESDWIRVVSDQHWNDKPRWSPDGNRIYFVSDRDGFACLWSQPVEPETKRPVGPPLPLYHIHQVRRSILNVGYGLMDIAVAPDKIVLNLGEITGNIWMTELAEDQQK